MEGKYNRRPHNVLSQNVIENENVWNPHYIPVLFRLKKGDFMASKVVQGNYTNFDTY